MNKYTPNGCEHSHLIVSIGNEWSPYTIADLFRQYLDCCNQSSSKLQMKFVLSKENDCIYDTLHIIMPTSTIL